MKTQTPKTYQPTVAARVAGEDIAVNDFVTVLSEVVELPSFLWNCSDVSLPPDELVRIRVLPRNEGMPVKVLRVCLPFVYVKYPSGRLWSLDTRQQQLVRLDNTSAGKVWKELKRPFRKRKRKQKKKRNQKRSAGKS